MGITLLDLCTLLLLSTFLSSVLSRNPNSASINYANDNESQTYIVQVQLPDAFTSGADDHEGLTSWYRSFLPETPLAGGIGESRVLVHSYTQVFSGFAAKLTKEEVDIMAKKEGFIRALPDQIWSLTTTHTASFLGLQIGPSGLWNSSLLGAGLIIGILDTGLVAGHPSFDGAGMPPPPGKWKGTCDFKKDCNNKVIGMRDIAGGPHDLIEGHGSHTASTAAGNFVANASAFGLASGVAVGMAPRAHIAMYRVCGAFYCSMSDILKGIDAAVHDGVDVISMSISGPSMPLDIDAVAIGSFAAVQKGIFFSCSAGNDGPLPRTVRNEAPWLLTVAASTVDRSFRATIRLGNGEVFHGETFDQDVPFSSNALPLLYSSYCNDFGELDVKGKVLICSYDPDTSTYLRIKAVKEAGGAAMIFVNPKNNGHTLFGARLDFNVVQVSFADGSRIISYAAFGAAGNTTASIFFNGTIIGSSPAPFIASFSSRGPSQAAPSILKPDITGPGVNIIAAWPNEENSSSTAAMPNFNIISGTSMSTPHLSGIAALLKNVHPDWSPAAIKSAIMTTSAILDGDKNPIKDEQYNKAGFLAMGAGHVNPSKASDPGLVYDLEPSDYIGYICWKLGDAGAKAIISHKADCKNVRNITEEQLNYPSITVDPFPVDDRVITINRTVTNVGRPKSTYKAKVEMPKKVSVMVRPRRLKFSKLKEKKSFSITMRCRKCISIGESVQGNLRWISKEHVVRSPIVLASVFL